MARGRASAVWLGFALLVLGAGFSLCGSASAEAAIKRSGTLHATVIDNFRAGESTTRYALKSGKQATVVRPTELAAEPGDRVAVTGEVRDGRLVGVVEATEDGPQILEVPPGPRKVAVLLLTFPGDPAQPWSIEETRSQVFTGDASADVFLDEESYGNISLIGKLDPDGDVFDWLALNTDTTGCPYNAWRTEANAAAAGAGIDLTGYDHIVYVFPQRGSCAWNGIAAVNSDWSLINGNLGVKTITHELGHNLGLHHAASLTCATATGTRVQDFIPGNPPCIFHEYGDPFDAQGNIATRHHNGWNLDKLGVLSSDNIETVDVSGTYSMQSALNPTAEPTVLRIPRTRSAGGDVNSWYYLEVRETGGVFENVLDASTTGVSIRVPRENQPAETLLLDANPATTTFTDAPLGAGQTLEGATARITTLAAGGGSATVSVEIDDEPPTAPTGLTATAGVDGVQLQWDASSDNFGVDRYVIFRDGEQIDTSTTAGFLDSFALPGEHEYIVYAEDLLRNRSEASQPAAATLAAIEGPACGSGSCRVTYWHTGAPANWTVPPGVGQAELTVEGAQGAGLGINLGARVVATLDSLTGETVTVTAGGVGQPYTEGGAGGFNGGGAGTFGGGGGGYSSVERGSNLVLLASGGGGRGASGFNAVTGSEPGGGSGGQGGSIGTVGLGGFSISEVHGARLGRGAGGDSAGVGAAGGAGGAVTGESTCAGGATAGGEGTAGGSLAGGGGAPNAGGGGGYLGGGQGGGGASDACGSRAGAGGGGGGSSFAAPGLSPVFTGGARRGDGRVLIAYTNPIAAPDHSYTTTPDQELVVLAASGVLSGASGPGGGPLSASEVTAPAHGDLTLNADGSFTYEPEPGYSGSDSFDYRATGDSGNYATAEVTLTVAEPPTASISAPADGASYVEGQAVNANFSCTEGSGGPGISLCTGTVGSGEAIDTSSPGSKEFTVTAISEDGLSSQVSVTYTVIEAPLPQPPTPPAPDPQPPVPSPPEPEPSVSIRGAVAPVVNRLTKIRLGCRGAATDICRGTLILRRIVRSRGEASRNSITLGRTRYAVPAGESRLISMRLRKAALALIKRVGQDRVRAEAIATVSGRRGAYRTIFLKRKPRQTLAKNHRRALVKYQRFGGLGGGSIHLVVAKNGNARLATPSGTKRASLNRKIQRRLTRSLRKARFARLKPSYEPATPIPDAFTHEVTYRGHTVRAVDTAASSRLQAVISVLDRIIAKLSR